MTQPGLDAAAAGAFAALLEDTHLCQPDELADLLVRHAAPLGVEELVLYLVDYEQTTLVPVPTSRLDRPVLRIDGTLGGRAFVDTTAYETDAGPRPGRRVWLPLIDGTERLGVMEIVLPGPVTDPLLSYCERYTHLAAQLVVGKSLYGDIFERLRRTRPMTVAAELQWTLLPPLVFATRGLVVAGALEPCYTVGGDSFDYAVDDSAAHLAVFDAMGHGLTAATTAAVSVSAYRNSRRQLFDLPGTYAAVDAALLAEFGGDRFATAVLAHLDLGTGRLRWVNAGHPPPLLLRGGKLVKTLDLRPNTPLGIPFGEAEVSVGEEQLEPGDRILLYTDGVIEARTAAGEFFTADRLAEFLERESAGGLPTPETLRRLRHAILAHQRGQLQDDATALLVEWRRDSELALLPQTVSP
jgi:Stage II sporulation protein E (SpoIIE)